MKNDNITGDVLGAMADDLKVQAWLARAEFRNPSLHDDDTVHEISKLAALRDAVRLQIHLGNMEARDGWHELEDQWRHLVQLGERAADDAGEEITKVINRLREGFGGSKKD